MASSNDETPDTRDASLPEAPPMEPWWPDTDDGHPVSELMAPVQGASSPFGDVEFPLPADDLGYEHPVTEINR